ncbi:hypothetical protein [Paenarthrobacter aurescens]|nr:hypothetical protein [Paenarthrobacter aurescens]MDO6142559.1 hypothetical protein [Paenarthrobacter aurescens]MDO6146406.1 hypothetical protein [Paenarthrobacter aurescens]MDO6157651.1 hypothetical protein [Paenarthrobacter aurescens]MDO6161636.1 hypothetical protein [Paenarthrobacter aurescens]
MIEIRHWEAPAFLTAGPATRRQATQATDPNTSPGSAKTPHLQAVTA